VGEALLGPEREVQKVPAKKAHETGVAKGLLAEVAVLRKLAVVGD